MRDNFSKSTIETLAKRVAYRCSNPECRKPTVGPNEDKNKTTNIGVAAHIKAAAPGGPRYDEDMTSEERKDISNGIWLCQSCSKLIDSDAERYTVELLKEWKQTAERDSLKALKSNRQFSNDLVKVDGEIVQQIVDVVNGEQYLHEIFANGQERRRIATEEDVKNFSPEIIDGYKRELGSRLKGNETNLQIISILLQEVENALLSNKRYGVLPMFSYIPRAEREWYVIVNDLALPFEKNKVQEYFWDAYEKYVIDSKYYHLMVILHDGDVTYVELGYQLCFPDVTERLYGFNKVKELVKAEKISLWLPEDRKRIDINTNMMGEKREEQIALTDYWIDQMKMIDAIEKYYKVKFHLPQKASEEDYQAIFVLHNAINKLGTSTFPGVPMERVLLKKVIAIEDEMLINDGSGFETLNLFGYSFKPVAAYMMKCTLIWKKKTQVWETSGGGIPVRVEFVCGRD